MIVYFRMTDIICIPIYTIYIACQQLHNAYVKIFAFHIVIWYIVFFVDHSVDIE